MTDHLPGTVAVRTAVKQAQDTIQTDTKPPEPVNFQSATTTHAFALSDGKAGGTPLPSTVHATIIFLKNPGY